MEPTETDEAQVPAGPLALATALSGVPLASLFVALFRHWLMPADDWWTLEMLAIRALWTIGPSCVIGVPVALLVLRDPNASALRWAMAGASAALISVLVVGVAIFGPYFPVLLLTFVGPTILLMSIVAAVLGALSGLGARVLLAVFLGISGR